MKKQSLWGTTKEVSHHISTFTMPAFIQVLFIACKPLLPTGNWTTSFDLILLIIFIMVAHAWFPLFETCQDSAAILSRLVTVVGHPPKAQLIKSCELCHTTTAGEVKFNSFLWLVKNTSKKNVLQHTSICNNGHKDLYRLYIHSHSLQFRSHVKSPRKLNFLKASWLTVHLEFYHTAKTSVVFCCEDS